MLINMSFFFVVIGSMSIAFIQIEMQIELKCIRVIRYASKRAFKIERFFAGNFTLLFGL